MFGYKINFALALSFALSLWAKPISLDIEDWQQVKYRKIKPNQGINIGSQTLRIKVNASSSALVYPFKEIQSVKGFKLQAQLKGDLDYGKKNPGASGADDFPLRLGLILAGQQQLNVWQKMMAPQWLKQLNQLAKAFSGMDKIYTVLFYSQAPQFKERKHPLSDYFFEVAGQSFNAQGNLNLKYTLDKPLTVIGIWLGADGDDTQSDFTVDIRSLEWF
ncbi:hypothetical protein MRY82_00030 [bacterium]|nr:hypothetical protein [bacterium]